MSAPVIGGLVLTGLATAMLVAVAVAGGHRLPRPERR